MADGFSCVIADGSADGLSFGIAAGLLSSWESSCSKLILLTAHSSISFQSLWECLTVGCKAFSLVNVKGMGTNDWVIKSLDD